MTTPFDDMVCALFAYLRASNANPLLYGTLLFTYSVLAAIILPIPVEVALILDPALPDWVKAVVLGGGKATGAILIFALGLRVEDNIRHWATRHPVIQRGLDLVFRFVGFTRWVGLLVLLSIPFMPDTVPIYVYGIFNKEGGAIRPAVFVLVNFAAGVIRAMVFLYVLPSPSAC